MRTRIRPPGRIHAATGSRLRRVRPVPLLEAHHFSLAGWDGWKERNTSTGKIALESDSTRGCADARAQARLRPQPLFMPAQPTSSALRRRFEIGGQFHIAPLNRQDAAFAFLREGDRDHLR